MGTDIYIFSQEIIKGNELIYNKLVGKENPMKEEMYWRKEYGVIGFFNTLYDFDNCDDTEINKEDLILFLKAILNNKIEFNYERQRENDIKILKKLIETTDFSKTKIFFHYWA